MSAASGPRLTATLGIISVISGVLLALTYEGTLPRIARNEARALEAAVTRVLPGAVRGEPLGDSGAGAGIYAGYGADGHLVGYAIPASARGYADVIQLLYGYSPERRQIVGMTVLRSNETPGLGDKIAKDPAFQGNFVGLDASEPGRIATVKSGKKEHPWEIDGISGATVSSKAVGRALKESGVEVLSLLPHPEARP